MKSALIITIMLIILYFLFSGLWFLFRDKTSEKRTIKALTWRVSLSVGLFLFLMLLFWLGWLHPHSLSHFATL